MSRLNALIGLAAVAALIHLFAAPLGLPGLGVAAKPVPVWVVAAALLHHRHEASSGRGSRWVAIGLILSGVADVLLEVAPFITGMVVFALAHLFYITATLDSRRFGAVGLLICGSWGAALFTFLAPNLGDLLIPIAVYTVVLVTMMWRAMARYSARGGRIFAMGAVLFGLSDSLIGLRVADFIFAGQDLAIILLYWAGQLGLARGAWEHDLPTERS